MCRFIQLDSVAVATEQLSVIIITLKSNVQVTDDVSRVAVGRDAVHDLRHVVKERRRDCLLSRPVDQHDDRRRPGRHTLTDKLQ